jgi:hypothetical protein
VSQLLINQYLGELDRIRKASGSSRESVLREAFKDLLKGWGRQHDLVFVPEYELDTATKDRRYVDGALLDELRVPFGNRSALDWVLDQHKERKPRDPTIREKFDTYRFADHKERVIDLLLRVATVSVETMRIVAALRDAPR